MARTGINQPSVDQMGAPRRALLEVLYAKGTARTSELRRDADIPQGSKRYHFDRLRVDPSDEDVDSWGYIKVVDRVPSEYGGSDERVWALTSAGEEYVEETLSVDPTTREEGLTSRIEALERTVREQQAQINEFEHTQQEAKEAADEARSIAESARMTSKQTASDLRSRVTKIDERVSSLRDDHQSLRAGVNEMGDTIVDKFNGLRDDAKVRIGNLEGENEQQADRIDELETTLADLQERLAEAEAKADQGGVFSRFARGGSESES